MIDTLMVIDASSKGNFEKLTRHRQPGALPFAGKYRLIDFALSSALHAGIQNVAIFPFGNYRSLQDHIGSGKRWDLDRKKDGLFILPPKHIHMPTETMLTFQRMHEHIEYFKRSSHTYVFLTQAHILWNIDIALMIDIHKRSHADVSEIMHQDQRLNTFILKKETLLSLIEDYANLPYKTVSEWTINGTNVDHRIIYHEGYTRYITDNFNYLKSNLAMLDFHIGRTVFKENTPIISKEKMAPPARYEKTASVHNSMVASGSVIAGTIRHSVIGRDVIIKEGATVIDSVIMPGCIVEGGAVISKAILDKATHVLEGAFLEGTLRDPYVSQKEQLITKETPLNVAFVSTESAPFVKTGGLGDVVNDLSRHLVRLGIKTSVIMPLFKPIRDKIYDRLERLFAVEIRLFEQPEKVTLYTMEYKGVNYYFIDCYTYFDRPMLYGYQDDFERFSFFNVAVAELLDEMSDFNLVHIHDWHAGILPNLLKDKAIKTVLTMHNVNYQGKFNPTRIPKKLSFLNGPVNFLEHAISDATMITTVSETYKDELKYPYYGGNLTPLLLQRERDLYGILNGLSSTVDPIKDTLIKTPYSKETISLKIENKTYMQSLYGLNQNENAFVIGMVSRITETKGFPLIIPMLERLFHKKEDVQFVLLGTGEDEWIKSLKKLKDKYPEKIALHIGFDATIPNIIYAGADVFLMPSRIEPCGISQMIAMKYGTLPIVRQTGGLNDTVSNYDPLTKRGTGFSFYEYDPNRLYDTVMRAYFLYHESREVFMHIMKKAMMNNFSLDKQAQRMMDVYHLAILNK